MDEIRKLQLTELYMLKDIAKLCKDNQIKYYLCGGTLLGAVRHGGFIPWDDDLDITMYRKDLTKLVKLLKEEYPEKYFVQDFRSDKEYTRYITKIRLNGTSQTEECYKYDNINHGIYIDIFPLDHTTKQDGIGLKLRGVLLRYLFAFKTTKHTKKWTTTYWKSITIKCIKPLTYLVPDLFINMLFDWCCTMTDKPGAKYTTSFASHYRWKRQMVSNEVYGEGTYYKFEDGEFMVPSQYEKLLVQIFSENYMELPPVEARNSGHVLADINLGKYEKEILG